MDGWSVSQLAIINRRSRFEPLWWLILVCYRLWTMMQTHLSLSSFWGANSLPDFFSLTYLSTQYSNLSNSKLLIPYHIPLSLHRHFYYIQLFILGWNFILAINERWQKYLLWYTIATRFHLSFVPYVCIEEIISRGARRRLWPVKEETAAPFHTGEVFFSSVAIAVWSDWHWFDSNYYW